MPIEHFIITLFDLMALRFADACSLIVREGLLYGYVVEENDLPVMRGRLLVNEQIRRRYGQIKGGCLSFKYELSF